MSVLDANVARLLKRAYRPERPSAALRARLLVELERRIDERRRGSGAIARPRFRRPIAIAAAALFLGAGVLVGVRWGGLGSDRPSGSGETARSMPGVPSIPNPEHPRGDAEDGGTEGTRTAVDPGGAGEAASGSAPRVAVALAGSVRDEETGAPIAAFRLTLLRRSGMFEIEEPIVRQIADEAGRFALEGVPPGPYEVFTEADGYAVRRTNVEADAGADAVTIALGRGGVVRGVVRSASTGEPVEGAIVLCEGDAPSKVLPVDPALLAGTVHRTATTGPDGTFELAHLASGSQTLRAVRRGFAPGFGEVVGVTTGETAEGIEIRLGSGGVVRGVVRDEEGTGIARQAVLVSLAELVTDRRLTYGVAVTDDEGKYEIVDLPPGFQVGIWLGDESKPYDGSPKALLPVKVVAGEVATLDFGAPVQERGVLAGRVRDARGAIVPGLSVTVQRVDDLTDTGWRWMPLDADGAFRFPDLRPGRYFVCVGGEVGPNFTIVGEGEARVGSGPVREFFLDPGSIEGRVLDGSSGEPLFAALIVFERIGAPGDHGEFAGRGMTDATGRFRLAHLSAGAYRVSVYDTRGAFGFENREPVQVRPAEAPSTVEFRLERGATVLLWVQDETGRPVSGASIRAFDAAGREREFALDPKSGADGTIVAAGLPAGRWEFRAERDGKRSDAAVVDAVAGETSERVLTLSSR